MSSVLHAVANKKSLAQLLRPLRSFILALAKTDLDGFRPTLMKKGTVIEASTYESTVTFLALFEYLVSDRPTACAGRTDVGLPHRQRENSDPFMSGGSGNDKHSRTAREQANRGCIPKRRGTQHKRRRTQHN